MVVHNSQEEPITIAVRDLHVPHQFLQQLADREVPFSVDASVIESRILIPAS